MKGRTLRTTHPRSRSPNPAAIVTNIESNIACPTALLTIRFSPQPIWLPLLVLAHVALNLLIQAFLVVRSEPVYTAVRVLAIALLAYTDPALDTTPSARHYLLGTTREACGSGRPRRSPCVHPRASPDCVWCSREPVL